MKRIPRGAMFHRHYNNLRSRVDITCIHRFWGPDYREGMTRSLDGLLGTRWGGFDLDMKPVGLLLLSVEDPVEDVR